MHTHDEKLAMTRITRTNGSDFARVACWLKKVSDRELRHSSDEIIQEEIVINTKKNNNFICDIFQSVIIAQWESECISLPVLSMARVMNLTACPLVVWVQFPMVVLEYFKGLFPR